MGLQTYKDLVAWQKSMNLVEEVYKVLKNYPQSEMFGLRSQTQRAAISVPSNLAEGFGRNSSQDFLRFCFISRGSLNELETQLLIGFRLGYLDESESTKLTQMIEEVSKILGGLIRSLNQKS